MGTGTWRNSVNTDTLAITVIGNNKVLYLLSNLLLIGWLFSLSIRDIETE